MSKITEKEVEHIAELARIRLDSKEKGKTTEDLSAILGYIDKLKEVNTDGAESVAHITGLENVFRQDESADVFSEVKPELLIIQAPKSDDNNYLKVKPVFDEYKNADN